MGCLCSEVECLSVGVENPMSEFVGNNHKGIEQFSMFGPCVV